MYTPQQEDEFCREFARRKKRQWGLSLALGFWILAAVIMEKGGFCPIFAHPVAGPAFFVLIVGTVILTLRNWRCPACDRYLGKGMSFKFCPYCGVPLKKDA